MSPDEAPTPAAHLECPDCGSHIPVTLDPPVVNEWGELVVEVNTDDLWAHSFTHDDIPG